MFNNVIVPLAERNSRRWLVGLGLAVLLACGCQRRDDSGSATGAQTTPPIAHEDTLRVFAAASLQDVFGKLAQTFEASHPGVDVQLSFAGSQELRAQLEHGARADVFASADERNMDELLRQKLVLEPSIFARNEPVIVISNECTAAVNALVDLPQLSRLVLGTPEVPIGRYSVQILDRASHKLGADFRSRVEAKVVSLELNVRQALARVTLGEAEAAIVYRTDALAAAGKVRVVAIEPEFNVLAQYPIARVASAAHPTLSVEWLALLSSSAGQQLLVDAGFLPATVPVP